jgi:hypothetical protein
VKPGWLRSRKLSATAQPTVDAELNTALAGDLTRRLFGKRLLVTLPIAGAALLAGSPEAAQAGTDGDWALTGNLVPDASKFLGTTNAQSLTIKTNNTARMTITSSGNVGIGTTTPSAALELATVQTMGIQSNSGATAPGAAAVLGQLSAAAPGANTAGVKGAIASPVAIQSYGVWGNHAGGGVGVYGSSVGGRGVLGFDGAASGYAYGVRGETASTSGYGVYGLASAVSGTATGVSGQSNSTSGRGVVGYSSATSGPTVGVWGEADSDVGIGVLGQVRYGVGYGVYGLGRSAGVYGHGQHIGVYGMSDDSDSFGIYGRARGDEAAIAIYGHQDSISSDNYAGYFQGRAHVTRHLSVVGTLSKGAGSFKIDHPLDPENKYLYHSFIESPDMKNVYDGVATLDANGQATVELPAWFEALNSDFRYQLTCIGAHAPIYIAEEIKSNRFGIAGGTSGLKVCWQVTGIRQDAYAQAHRIPVEEDKPARERGMFLHAKEHGKSAERGLDHARMAARAQMLERTLRPSILHSPKPSTGAE